LLRIQEQKITTALELSLVIIILCFKSRYILTSILIKMAVVFLFLTRFKYWTKGSYCRI